MTVIIRCRWLQMVGPARRIMNHLERVQGSRRATEAMWGGASRSQSIEDLLRRRLGPVVRNTPEPPRGVKSDLHPLVVGMAERVLIELVLERTRGNQVAAAKLLGINRNTLRRKLDDYGLDPDSSRGRR